MKAYPLLVLVLMLTFVSCHASETLTGWGETNGPVSATVSKSDDPRGLSIRPRPSAVGRALGHLAVGTRIRGHANFSNGWMEIQGPSGPAWVDMEYLQPLGGSATVTRVDPPRGCLQIRKGPSAWSEVTGCAEKGERLELTGVWSEGFWAQVKKPVKGWVEGKRIRTGFGPLDRPGTAIVNRDRPQPPRAYHMEKDPVGDRPSRESARKPRRPSEESPRRREVRDRRRGQPPPPRVNVNAGPVGVHVGQGGAVGVRVFGLRIGVAPGGSVNVGFGP